MVLGQGKLASTGASLSSMGASARLVGSALVLFLKLVPCALDSLSLVSR